VVHELEIALFLHLLGVLLFVAGIVVAGVAFEAARRRELPAEVALLLGLTRVGVLLVLLTRCLNVEQAYREVDWRALILIGPTVDPVYRGWVRHAIRLLVGATRERSGLFPIVLEDYVRMGPRRIFATARAALADAPEQRLPRIEAPVLVVRGEHDALTTPDWARRCAALAPRGAFVELTGAAHAAHVSHTRDVAELVERFLAKCDDGVRELVGRVDHGHMTGSG